jgi:ABC-type glycerol-3-phosphate transport system permease component
VIVVVVLFVVISLLSGFYGLYFDRWIDRGRLVLLVAGMISAQGIIVEIFLIERTNSNSRC